MLLISRAVQGMFAAIAAPSTLALLTATFTEQKERARAIGLFSSVLGAGASLGLVLGGLLTDLVSWRWGFFINVPIGVVLVAAAPRLLPETERKSGHFDVIGAITSTVGMASLVYGFVRASSEGWSENGTLIAFVAGVALLITFVFNELRVAQPVLPLHLFASRQRSGSHVVRLFLVSGMFSMFFFVSQYMQGVLNFSPLEAGLAFLPQTLIMFAMVQVIPKIVPKLGLARTVGVGVATALVGMFWLSQLGDSTAYFPNIVVPMMIIGAGVGTAFIPLTTLGLADVAPQDAGAASGLVNVSQQLGGSLGLAILVTVFGSASDNAASNPVAAAGTALEVSHELAHGVGAVLTGSAIFLTLAFVTVIAVIRKPSSKTVELSAFEGPTELAS